MADFNEARFGQHFIYAKDGKTYEYIGKITKPAVVLRNAEGQNQVEVIDCPNATADWRKVEINHSQAYEALVSLDKGELDMQIQSLKLAYEKTEDEATRGLLQQLCDKLQKEKEFVELMEEDVTKE